MFDILRVVQFFFRRVLVVVFLEMVNLILVLCIAVVPRPQLRTRTRTHQHYFQEGEKGKKKKRKTHPEIRQRVPVPYERLKLLQGDTIESATNELPDRLPYALLRLFGLGAVGLLQPVCAQHLVARPGA